MKRVVKSGEPKELKQYRDRYKHEFRRWRDFKKSRDVEAIRAALWQDQSGICAYCEIQLHSSDRSVEHIIPCCHSTREKNHDLDWQNMLMVCKGGLQNVSIPGEDDSLRNSRPPHKSSCCGAAKENKILPLSPLEFPASRLFRFRFSDGSILPDEDACNLAKIPVEAVRETINLLNLNVQRLKDCRLAIIEEVLRNLEFIIEAETIDDNRAERKLAEEYLGDGSRDWPSFFTTIRWVLRDGAEQHLDHIGKR